MKESFRVGLTLTRRIEISRDRTIDFMGEEARIYASPFLLRDVEQTCRELLLAHLDNGQDSVGFGFNFNHTGATLLGMTVDLTVKIAAIEKNRVRFEFEGRDTVEEICRGEHTRVVVETAKVIERLKAKAAKARAAT